MYGHFLAFRETMEDCADRLANNSDGWFWSRYLAMAIHRFTGRLGRQYAVLYILHTCKWLFLFFGLREAGKIWWKMAKVEPMKQIVAVSKQTHVPPYCNPKNIRGLKDPTKPVPLGAEIHGVEVGRIMSFHAMWTPDSNKLWAVKVNIIDQYIYIQHCLEVPQFITQGLWIRGRSALCNHLRGDCAGKWVARQFLAWRARLRNLRNMCSCGIWIIWIAVAHLGLLLLECYWFETLLMVTDWAFLRFWHIEPE